jgi:hypothetical protein
MAGAFLWTSVSEAGCAPTGIRTPVLALKGPRPGPLDDGGVSGGDCTMREEWSKEPCVGMWVCGLVSGTQICAHAHMRPALRDAAYQAKVRPAEGQVELLAHRAEAEGLVETQDADAAVAPERVAAVGHDMPHAGLHQRAAITLALGVGQHRHAAQPIGTGVFLTRGGFNVNRRNAQQVAAAIGADVPGARGLIAGIDGGLGRLARAQHRLAQGAGCGGGDGAKDYFGSWHRATKESMDIWKCGHLHFHTSIPTYSLPPQNPLLVLPEDAGQDPGHRHGGNGTGARDQAFGNGYAAQRA